jgi:hypothetical protein
MCTIAPKPSVAFCASGEGMNEAACASLKEEMVSEKKKRRKPATVEAVAR